MRSMTESPRCVAIACALIVGCTISTDLADSRPIVRLIRVDALRADPAAALPEWSACRRADECMESPPTVIEYLDVKEGRVEPSALDLSNRRWDLPCAEHLMWTIAPCADRGVIDTRI